MIEIDEQSEYLIDTLFHNNSDESHNYTSTYLKIRNLCISRKIESLGNLPGPKYFLIKSNQFILKKYTSIHLFIC